LKKLAINFGNVGLHFWRFFSHTHLVALAGFEEGFLLLLAEERKYKKKTFFLE
jgi:hypothetical protein